MKNLKLLRKVILMLVIVACICGVSTINNASQPQTNDIGDIVGTIPQVSATPSPTATPTPTPSSSPIGNLSANSTNSTSLPKTGANDTGMWVLIGACVIAAIYTYKKVRDYNV